MQLVAWAGVTHFDVTELGFQIPPAGGSVWKNELASAATPLADNSRSASIWGSSGRRTLRATG
ncbi:MULTISPECIES: hypothetical protein [Mycobacterium]|uniref:Uncharacterized protein n=1 Tax=Mycobacterium syngnathidarum TaxID=1908205 RepID=A0A1S1K652_9MYCO|nr:MULTISPECIES: hypothetical protein [Mycobacterium]MCG7609793.1 hypothetical protein [Mycobacterium sp. CnD-18-1]OHU01359.1 hypothetical protein BKG61_10075 [Mycobacterium syngnathidarum]OLT95286.1 hypothetical protein BKG60_15550 [Mycobacterium syngnathidarum]